MKELLCEENYWIQGEIFMMKLQITTFVLIGGIIGFFTDGVMIGVGVGALVFIAYRLEKLLGDKHKE